MFDDLRSSSRWPAVFPRGTTPRTPRCEALSASRLASVLPTRLTFGQLPVSPQYLPGGTTNTLILPLAGKQLPWWSAKLEHSPPEPPMRASLAMGALSEAGRCLGGPSVSSRGPQCLSGGRGGPPCSAPSGHLPVARNSLWGHPHTPVFPEPPMPGFARRLGGYRTYA